MAKQTEKLFSDFTAPSRQEWRDKIEVEKGESIQKIEIINDLPKDEEDGKN